MLLLEGHLVTLLLFMSGLGACRSTILTARVGDHVQLSFPAAKPYREVRFFDPYAQEFAVFSQGHVIVHAPSKIEFTGFETQRDFQFLVIKVTLMDAGTYTCATGSDPQSETLIPGCNTTIIVLQTPTVPRLYTNQLSPALGESVQLICFSQSTSVPFARALQFEWRRGNMMIPQSPNSDLYSIRELKAEHWGNTYTCLARDETGPFSDPSNPVRLNVLCDPLVREIPRHFAAKPYQSFQVSFPIPIMERDASLDVMSPRCRRMVSLPGDGAPPLLESEFRSEVVERSLHLENLTLTFNFTLVTPNLAGTYSCRIKGHFSSRRSRLCGFVLHVDEPLPKPLLRPLPSYSPGEVTLRCLLPWTPFPPDVRVLEYSFEVDGSVYADHVEMEGYLVIHLEGGHHNLRCKAHFGRSTSPQSDMLSITVPDASPYLTMNQSSPVYMVRGNQEAVYVECQASCEGCLGQWTFQGSKFSPHIKGSLLVLFNLTSAQEGKYVCIGEKIPPPLPRPTPLSLDVRLVDPPYANFTINGHAWTEVNRSDMVTLRCEGKGLPLPRVVILPRSGVPLFQMQGGQPLEYEARGNWSLAEARIEHVECSHGGQFLCLLFGDELLPYKRPLGYRTATLRVNCEPYAESPPPSTFPIALLSNLWLGVDVNAYPWSSFTWYHQGLGVNTLACSNVTLPKKTKEPNGGGSEGVSGTAEVSTHHIQHDDACCQKINSYYRIQNATVADLGIYSLAVVNKFGFLNFTVEVVPQGPPDPPRSVACVGQTKNSVTVSWSPSPVCASRYPVQTFWLTVEAVTKGTEPRKRRREKELSRENGLWDWTSSILNVTSGNSSKRARGNFRSWTVNVTGRAKIVRTLIDLSSKSTVTLSLVAENAYGRSQPTIIHCTTVDYPYLEYVLMVIAVTAAVVFLVGIVMLIVSKLYG